MFAFGGFARFMHGRSWAGFLLDTDFDRNRCCDDVFAGGKDRHSLDDIAKLARVSGPAIAFEFLVDSLVESLGTEVVTRAEVFEEIISEKTDVLRSFA